MKTNNTKHSPPDIEDNPVLDKILAHTENDLTKKNKLLGEILEGEEKVKIRLDNLKIYNNNILNLINVLRN